MYHFNLMAIFLMIMMACTSTVCGKTLVIEGKLDGTVTVKKTVRFSGDQTLSRFTYQFSVPATYDNSGNVQRLDDFRVSAKPEPSEAKETIDQYGNRSRKLIWHNLTTDAQISISYTAGITSAISPRTSTALFPLTAIPVSEQIFLMKSKQVQSDSEQIIRLASELTYGATTEYQAVNAILNYVADAIKYQYNPKQYDALFGLNAGAGNCQNFSHLAVALLRASGIPARVSIGQALKDRWKIPLDNKGSSLVQGMGEGLHAWIEVWYPDFGWLPCDPQQSRLFTSTRHIKYGHGLDASDVLEYWSGSPIVPQMSESFEAKYSIDTVDLRLREALAKPANYQLAGPFTTVASPQEESPVIKPKPKVIPQRLKPKITPTLSKRPVSAAKVKPPKPGAAIEMGNMDFPNLVEASQVVGDVTLRSFDRETAEYATSKYLYTQAFTLDTPLAVKDVGLAMRKFGGDGTIYIDVVRDKDGKPSLDGIRSMPVSLDKITRRPGYYWVNFQLPNDTNLAAGKYWLVLRHSGEAIMNWFYTPGKRINGPDDSRSTVQGWQWEDVLSGEFVYRVRGIVANR